MIEEPINQPSKQPVVGSQPDKTNRTPQEELEDLLQSSRKTTRPSSGIRLPIGGGENSINWLAWGVGLLALLLVVGTSYFIVRGIGFNQGDVVFELNEDSVTLKINDRGYGEIDSGATIQLRSGEHRAHLSKEGFLELEEVFNLSRNDELVLQFELLPIPVIQSVVSQPVSFTRLNVDGSEISYLDVRDNLFKSIDLLSHQTVTLFQGSFPNVREVAWSPVTQSAVVQLAGSPSLPNTFDNREVRGAYIPLGERPVQGAPRFNGTSSWLFADEFEPAIGWRPVRLSDSIRQTVFSADGGTIAYLYEPADGEYSLIQAWPDGSEWERVIVEMPRLTNPTLTWSRYDRYLLIQNNGKLLVADLISEEINDVFTDRLAGSRFAISTDGNQVAYLANIDSKVTLKIYDLITGTAQVVKDVDVREDSRFVWTGISSILIALSNQTFINFDTTQQSRLLIPFVSAEVDLRIEQMSYSLSARTLMLITETGIFTMKI